mgnify:CR=1 FL=1
MEQKLPRDKDRDYTNEMASARRHFVEQQSGTTLEHMARYSFDPSMLPGNIENFSGVAQVPIGFAGPLSVNGEFAQGNFFVPLATTEGTLVGSYNRGMKLTRMAGGVTTTVVDDAMQRAPVFVFENARYARDFGLWVDENITAIRERAEETTRSGKLKSIEQYAAGKMRWLRFNFTTGDAAGQNMVGKATYAACQWIVSQIKGLQHFALAANLDTDKKHSQINTLHTRGKRVIAEITLKSELMKNMLRTTGEAFHYQRGLSNVGALLSGSINNGAHSANAITAIFIACGQDVANVAESSSAIVYGELLANGDFYYSITIPSLIVATYGGGTGLATQKECLELLGCYGKGKVNKFAEIVAATVLCGELSLGGAVVSHEWVSSHDEFGRNRP